MAKEKGFYEKKGLDVEIIERNPAKNNVLQVENGEVEYGIADSSILLYRAKGYHLKVVASIFQHNPLVLLTRRDSGILSPYELKGKIVAYQAGLDDAAITAMLSFAGLKSSDYTHVPHDFTHKKLISGEVDAIESYITNEPFKYKKSGHNINILNPMSYGIDLYGDNIITTDEEIINHPDRVKRFVDATMLGWQYAFDHKEEAILAIKKLNPKLDTDSLWYEAVKTEQLIMPKVIPIGTTSQERFEVISNLYLSLGMAKDVELKAALKELIYNPNQKQNEYQKYIYPLLGGIVVLGIIALLLYFHNKRLKFLVREQVKELESYFQHFERLMEMQQNMIVLTNNERPEYANKAFYTFIGFDSLEFFLEIPQAVDSFFMTIDGYFDSHLCTESEHWIDTLMGLNTNKQIVAMLDSEGIIHTFTVSITPFDDKRYILSFTDITSTMLEYVNMEKKATHDPLTGAHNRSFFDHYFDQILEKARQNRKILGIIMIDIDHFKDVNDTFGHETGDAVLKMFVQIINNSIRQEDNIVRWGGEEFIILANVTSNEEVQMIAENLRHKIATSVFDLVEHITISLGVATLHSDESIQESIRRSDEALYRAKEEGRNKVVFKS